MPAVAPIDQAGLLPQRAGAGDRLRGALVAGAARAADRADARLRGGPRTSQMYAMLRRYIVGTTAADARRRCRFCWWLMPYLAWGSRTAPTFREHATTAARLVLVAAALQLIWGWTKSFPVSIGRPGLRIVAQTVEIAVLRAAAARVRRRSGARPAARRRCSSRPRRSARSGRCCCSRVCAATRRTGGAREMKVLVVSGIWPPDVGGPASHAPEVAAFLRGARARGRGRDHGRRRACAPTGYPVRWVPRSLPAGVRHAQGVRARRRRARARPTSSTRRACSGARRSAR